MNIYFWRLMEGTALQHRTTFLFFYKETKIKPTKNDSDFFLTYAVCNNKPPLHPQYINTSMINIIIIKITFM